tara:strand:- start:1200 stop:1619 length:420 start_codon:yes stop_codon:yes gene_type:complete
MSDKNTKFVSIVLKAGSPQTVSGRVYPVGTVKDAIDKFNKQVESRGPVPGGIDVAMEMAEETLSLEHVAFVAEKLSLDENNNVQVEGTILDTKNGNYLKSILEDVRFFTVGKGMVTFEKNEYVVTDFDIIRVDATLDNT